MRRIQPWEQRENRVTPDGVDFNTTQRLIGVELTFISPGGNREELMMLVPPQGKFDLPQSYPYGGAIEVTLHTSHGDRQARIQL